jgi:hypothetical protein
LQNFSIQKQKIFDNKKNIFSEDFIKKFDFESKENFGEKENFTYYDILQKQIKIIKSKDEGVKSALEQKKEETMFLVPVNGLSRIDLEGSYYLTAKKLYQEQ